MFHKHLMQVLAGTFTLALAVSMCSVEAVHHGGGNSQPLHSPSHGMSGSRSHGMGHRNSHKSSGHGSNRSSRSLSKSRTSKSSKASARSQKSKQTGSKQRSGTQKASKKSKAGSVPTTPFKPSTGATSGKSTKTSSSSRSSRANTNNITTNNITNNNVTNNYRWGRGGYGHGRHGHRGRGWGWGWGSNWAWAGGGWGWGVGPWWANPWLLPTPWSCGMFGGWWYGPFYAFPNYYGCPVLYPGLLTWLYWNDSRELVIESGQDIWFAVYRKNGNQLTQEETPRALTKRARKWLFKDRSSDDIIVIADAAHKLTPDLPETGNENVQIVVNLPEKNGAKAVKSMDDFRKEVVSEAPKLIDLGTERAQSLKTE